MTRFARPALAAQGIGLVTAIGPAMKKRIAAIFLLFLTTALALPGLHAQSRPFAQTFPHGTLFEDDFEIGGMDNWGISPGYSGAPGTYIGMQPCPSGGGGTYGVTTAWAHSGQYSFVNTLTSASSVQCALAENIPTTNTPNILVTVYMPSGFSFSGGNLRIANLGGVSGDGNLYLTTSAGSIFVTSTCTGKGSHALSLNSAYTIEQEWNISAKTESIYVNGALDSSGTNCSLPVAPWQYDLGVVDFGGTTVSGSIYYDDVMVNSSPITYSSHSITVRHPTSFGRTALPFLLTMYGTTGGDNVIFSMDGTQVGTYPVSGNSMSVQFNCCTGYSAGNHTLLVQEETGSTVNASWSETIPSYNSSFPVSIDGYNNLTVGGVGIFPILPFVGDYGPAAGSNQFQFEFWIPTYMTASGWTSGVAQPVTSAAWGAAANGMFSDKGALSLGTVQPAATWNCNTGPCMDGGTYPTTENAYISAFTASQASNTHLLGYSWVDEPTNQSVNSTSNPVTWSAVANWTGLTHASDTNHLVWLNNPGIWPPTYLYQGFFNLPYGNAPVTGEVLSMDSYPVQSQGSNVVFNIATWVGQVQQFIRLSYGLVPYNFDLEGSCFANGCSSNPNGNQLREEAWLATIHGAKAITWFVAAGGSGGTSSDQLTGIAAFKSLSQTTGVLAALTAPATALTVSSNQTAAGTRVDAMVKQVGSTVTVFGQRLTDVGETDAALNTTFTIAGCSTDTTATVVGESRSVSVNGCQISDTFNAYDTHVYQFTQGTGNTGPAPPTNLIATVQ
jgi:hypothetical protein